MRMHGHAEHDPADYVPRELLRGVREEGPGRAVRERPDQGGRDRRGHRQAGAGGRPPVGHRRPAQGARRPDARPQQHRGRCLCRLSQPTARPPTWRRSGWRSTAEMDARPGRLPHRRGRRPVRRRVQGDQGLPGQVRPAAGGGHPDRRDRVHRARRGCRAGRAAAGGGVPVRRLHLLRLRPDHQRDGAPPLPHRRPDAGDDAGAVRRAAACRAHALARAWSRYFAHVPGPQDRDARHARGRRRPADQLRSGTTTRCCTWRTSTSTGGSRRRRRSRWTRSRSGWPRSCARAATSP